jgi:hypothetical protein
MAIHSAKSCVVLALFGGWMSLLAGTLVAVRGLGALDDGPSIVLLAVATGVVGAVLGLVVIPFAIWAFVERPFWLSSVLWIALNISVAALLGVPAGRDLAPINAMLLLVASMALTAAALKPVLHAPRNAGRCPVCDYDLHGCLRPGCPECGWGRRRD